MIETFIALLFAHVLADYVFQTNWMVERKRTIWVMLLHIIIVLAAAAVATGNVLVPAILFIAGAHLLIDVAKTYIFPDNLATHMADHAAHLLSLIAVAAYAPELWTTGIWATSPPVILHAMVLAAGLFLATRAGGLAIAHLMTTHKAPESEATGGLHKGGQVIGLLERGLIFFLLLAAQPAAIGFLVAAKSILRFGNVQDNHAASEYMIIGTLASYGWAIVITLATLALRDLLPPLANVPLKS